MAHRQAFCVLVGPLSRSSDQWRQSAVHGQSAGPKPGQSRLAHGRAKSPHEPQLSWGVFSPHAEQTRASQSHHGHGPQTGKNYLPYAEGESPLSGTQYRGLSAQRSRASAPTITQASQALGM